MQEPENITENLLENYKNTTNHFLIDNYQISTNNVKWSFIEPLNNTMVRISDYEKIRLDLDDHAIYYENFDPEELHNCTNLVSLNHTRSMCIKKNYDVIYIDSNLLSINELKTPRLHLKKIETNANLGINKEETIKNIWYVNYLNTVGTLLNWVSGVIFHAVNEKLGTGLSLYYLSSNNTVYNVKPNSTEY